MIVDTLTVKQALYLDSFIRSLRAQNVSDRTVETYSEAVSQLATYLVEMRMPVRPEDITREHVESFIGHLLKKWKPATASNRYRALQRYFKWLVEEGEIKGSPMIHMKPPRVPEQPPPVLTEEEIKRLLKTCDGRAHEDRRDLAIIRLLLDTGLRRSELAGLTLDDVDLDAGAVTVLGKGGRRRTVAFGRKAARDIDRYLRVRALHRNAAFPHLWLGKAGPMTPQGVYPSLPPHLRPPVAPGRGAGGGPDAAGGLALQDDAQSLRRFQGRREGQGCSQTAQPWG